MKFHTVRKTALVAVSSLGMLYGGQAMAQEMYVGQLFLMGTDYCPNGSMPANGALLNIVQNQALYALLGTRYGGNGSQTFGLPDLRGRSPIGTGQGPGLTYLSIGAVGGAESVTLTQSHLPMHTHQISSSTTATASTKAATHATPAPDRVPAQTMNAGGYIAASEADTTLGATTTSTASVSGNSTAFSTRDPYLAMTWCIATVGLWPSRP